LTAILLGKSRDRTTLVSRTRKLTAAKIDNGVSAALIPALSVLKHLSPGDRAGVARELRETIPAHLAVPAMIVMLQRPENYPDYIIRRMLKEVDLDAVGALIGHHVVKAAVNRFFTKAKAA